MQDIYFDLRSYIEKRAIAEFEIIGIHVDANELTAFEMFFDVYAMQEFINEDIAKSRDIIEARKKARLHRERMKRYSDLYIHLLTEILTPQTGVRYRSTPQDIKNAILSPRNAELSAQKLWSQSRKCDVYPCRKR